MSDEQPEAERALDELAHRHAGHGELEQAAWTFLRGAHLAFARGDRAQATRFHALAVHAAHGAARLVQPNLIPHLLLFDSELAAEAGQVEASADVSARALAGFRAADDPAGVIAVWTARAERALRAGNVEAAREIATELLPALDVRGDREAGVWLRVRLAAALARAGRRAAAEPLLVEAIALTAIGSGERMAVTAEAMRVCLDDGRPRDALAHGVTALDAPSDGPRQLHAEVLVLCAVALARMGERDEAARFEARAAAFDSPGLREARARLPGSAPPAAPTG